MTKAIKRTLAEDEEVKLYFSICNRFIKFKITLSLLKWLFIFLGISFALFFVDKMQINLIPSIETGINNSNLINNISLEQSSEAINETIVQIWVLLALVFFLIIVPMVLVYYNFYLKISNEFVLTNKRILVKRGWLSTHIKTIYYNRITDISISQTFLERFITSGTLSISTAGSDGYEVVLYHIGTPYKTKQLLFKLRSVTSHNDLSPIDDIEGNV